MQLFEGYGLGGNYLQTKGSPGEGHHMWAQAACESSGRCFDSPGDMSLRRDVPCIRMEKLDHEDTLSHGRKGSLATAYRTVQKELLEEKRFEDAFYMDAQDHRIRHGDKYLEGIARAEQQMLSLAEQKKVTLDEKLRATLEKERQVHAKIADLREEVAKLKSELKAAKAEEKVQEKLSAKETQLAEAKSDLRKSVSERIDAKVAALQTTLEQKFKLAVDQQQIRLEKEQAERLTQTYGVRL